MAPMTPAPAAPLARIGREPDAETIILELCRVLLGNGKSDKGLMNLVVHGFQHTPKCPHGQWLSQDSPRPHGDPCSDRCQYARTAISMAGRWLKAHEVEALATMVQPDLFGEAS